MPTYAAFLLLLANACPAAQGALAWERQQIEVRAAPDATTVQVAFPFKNAGSAPVTIAGVASSCSCLTGLADRDRCAPGESGSIIALFTVGERSGTQHPTLTVTSDDPGAGSVVLALHIILPELPRLSPAFVHWQPGEPARAQAVTIHLPAGCPYQPAAVSVPEPAAFRAELRPAAAGSEAAIVVTPLRTNAAVEQILSLTTTRDGKPGRSFPLYARVLAPADPPAAETGPVEATAGAEGGTP